jgi:drug/metabolite transporter (DMT)-like permease
MKHGMNKVGRIGEGPTNLVTTFVRVFSNPFVDIGFILYLVASLVWIVILSRVPLSFAYPMVSLAYVVVVVLSKFLFHEDVGMMRLAGTFVICCGVFLISRS